MNSNERASHQRRACPADAAAQADLGEQTLKTGRIQIERKNFVFALKENQRGRFLRITEDAHGRRDRIIIPAPGLEEFRKALDDMVKAAEESPGLAEDGETVGL
jgi:hypothetical protein